jgi:hypothetical protein
LRKIHEDYSDLKLLHSPVGPTLLSHGTGTRHRRRRGIFRERGRPKPSCGPSSTSTAIPRSAPDRPPTAPSLPRRKRGWRRKGLSSSRVPARQRRGADSWPRPIRSGTAPSSAASRTMSI